MSVKETIFANLENALKQITKSNGYSQTATVTRKAVGIKHFRDDQLPLLKISSSDEETPETSVGSNQRSTMNAIILGTIKGNDIAAAANDFQADVRKCLHAADLGSNVIYKRIRGGSSEEGEGIVIFAEILEILYYYPEASP